MNKQKFGVTVYPRDRDFSINFKSTSLGSRTYANSSNAYRGARAALRNIKNQNVTNESNYGNNICAVVNDNGFVIAATDGYARSSSAAQTANRIIENASNLNLKKFKLDVYPTN